MKYFVVDRYRQYIDIEYVKKFLNTKANIKFHNSAKDAFKELHNGFYDDSDYGVFSINNGIIKRIVE